MKCPWTKQGLCTRHVKPICCLRYGLKERPVFLSWVVINSSFPGCSLQSLDYFCCHLPEPATAALPWIRMSDSVSAATSNGDRWQRLCSGYSSESLCMKPLMIFWGPYVRLCFAGWLWSNHKLWVFSRLGGCSVSLQKVSVPCSAGLSL